MRLSRELSGGNIREECNGAKPEVAQAVEHQISVYLLELLVVGLLAWADVHLGLAEDVMRAETHQEVLASSLQRVTWTEGSIALRSREETVLPRHTVKSTVYPATPEEAPSTPSYLILVIGDLRVGIVQVPVQPHELIEHRPLGIEPRGGAVSPLAHALLWVHGAPRCLEGARSPANERRGGRGRRGS